MTFYKHIREMELDNTRKSATSKTLINKGFKSLLGRKQRKRSGQVMNRPNLP